ncbi:MAG: hypothetical protein PWP64_942 [Candidatus Cloacimonadota bacterium]|jgi:hypothetical protein|nr:hypothetical protein [Candidatus Cloacimonadota bacterium]
MTETQNNTQKKTKSVPVVEDKHKVSLVELIMILLLIGLVFVFVFGMRQLREDKAKEAKARESFAAILPILDTAIEAAEEFKRTDEFGDYPFDFGQLNLSSTDDYTIQSNDNGELYLETSDFRIHYDSENYGFIVTSKAEFGKAGIEVIYNLADRSYRVEDPAPDKKPTIKDEWLPQE